MKINGINVHNDNEVNRVKQLGCEWVRIDINWQDIEKSKGRYSWGTIDKLVSAYKNNGFKIYATLMGSPAWHRASFNIPPDISEWSSFCVNCAKRFGSKIDVYGLWNEPNLGKRFWTGSCDEFFKVIVVGGSNAIRSVNPNLKIAVSDFATTGNSDWSSWLSKAKKYRNYFDITSIHSYHSSASTVIMCFNWGKVPVIGWIVPKWRPYNWYTDSIGRDVFLTEVGLEANYGNSKEENKQNEFVKEIENGKKQMNVKAIMFYTLKDADSSLEKPYGFYDIFGNPKKVAR